MFYIKNEIGRNENNYRALFSEACNIVSSFTIYGEGNNKQISYNIKSYADKEAYDIISSNPYGNGHIKEDSKSNKYSEVMAMISGEPVLPDIDDMIEKAILKYLIANDPAYASGTLIESSKEQE